MISVKNISFATDGEVLAAEIADRLRRRGLKLPKKILTATELAEALK